MVDMDEDYESWREEVSSGSEYQNWLKEVMSELLNKKQFLCNISILWEISFEEYFKDSLSVEKTLEDLTKEAKDES